MIVCIDAGHGGRDPGSVGDMGPEKDYTLIQALVTESFLVAAGFDPVMTRRKDRYVPLWRRAQVANEREADCFVSLHWNFAPGAEVASGTQALHHRASTAGKQLAEALLEEVAPLDSEPGERWERTVALPDASYRTTPDGDPFVPTVLSETRMPAVLLEVEFGSNALDAKRMMSPGYQVAVAQAIVDAIETWDHSGGGGGG